MFLGNSVGCSPEHSSTSAITSPGVPPPRPARQSLMRRSSTRFVKDKPQRLLNAPINGVPRLMGFPDAAYKNNSDGSSQRGQCIFTCQPRNMERDTRGSLIDYESHKIKRTVLSTTVAELHAFMKCYGSAQFYRRLWLDMTAQPVEVHLRTDANNLVTTAASTRLPEQKETIHMIQMLRQEACSGQMHDLAHVLTQ